MMQDESDKLHSEIVYSTPRSNHFRRSSKTSTFSQGLFSNRNNEGSEDFQITDSYQNFFETTTSRRTFTNHFQKADDKTIKPWDSIEKTEESVNEDEPDLPETPAEEVDERVHTEENQEDAANEVEEQHEEIGELPQKINQYRVNKKFNSNQSHVSCTPSQAAESQ